MAERMNEIVKTGFRKMLIKERNKCTEEFFLARKELKNDLKTASVIRNDSLGDCCFSPKLPVSRHTTENLFKRLKGIEKALKRVEQGTYGICLGDDCGDEIPVKRLQVVPFTPFCLKCGEENSSTKNGFVL